MGTGQARFGRVGRGEFVLENERVIIPVRLALVRSADLFACLLAHSLTLLLATCSARGRECSSERLVAGCDCADEWESTLKGRRPPSFDCSRGKNVGGCLGLTSLCGSGLGFFFSLFVAIPRFRCTCIPFSCLSSFSLRLRRRGPGQVRREAAAKDAVHTSFPVLAIHFEQNQAIGCAVEPFPLLSHFDPFLSRLSIFSI